MGDPSTLVMIAPSGRESAAGSSNGVKQILVFDSPIAGP